MAENKFPLLEKIKDLAIPLVTVVGVLYIIKLVFGLYFEGNIGIGF